ncbi:MAG: tol-pal system-associated acyl-CoA thioesterase [Proteobacteria bacterium]|nr:tol-pal system-associated acyl-CoA thioesterase [Pseudomonadota bacterium]
MQRDPAQVFRWPVRVYYEDTDSGGVVYYANYLRFFERARTEWLRSLGVDQQALAHEAGLQFVVRRAEIDFLRGARLDDLLEITVELALRKRTYLMLKQRALRGAEQMAEALVQAACVRREDFKPAAIPAALAAQLPEALHT